MRPTELDLDSIPKASAVRETSKRQAAPWRRVARSLRVDGPQTAAAMAKNLGYSVQWVQRLMKAWTKWGYVDGVGRTYKLTELAADFGKPTARRPRTPRPRCVVCGRKVTARYFPPTCTGSRPCSDLVFKAFDRLHPRREGEDSYGAWTESEWPGAIRLARAKYAAEHPTECLRIDAVDEDDEP